MNLGGVDRLLAAAQRSAEALEQNRSHLAPLLDDAADLLVRGHPSRVPASLAGIADMLHTDADELRWRRQYLSTHAPPIPWTPLRFGSMPRRRPHLDGDFGDGPFSMALAGLGPSAAELRALDQLATTELELFLALRHAAEGLGSPFDWSAGGALWFGACSGPVPAAGEDSCIRHDFIYRNWRRLRDDYAIDLDAGDKLKAWADAQLGDEVHDSVRHDWRTYLNPVNLTSGGIPVLPFLWAEVVEPAVENFGDGAWHDPAQPLPVPYSGEYYGDTLPSSSQGNPLVTDAVSPWLCPDGACTAEGN